MTTALINAIPNNGATSTGTEIRAWVQAVHNALAAIGMVQTADTGQVSISTMTNPAANDTQAGFEVWRFDDDLQAVAPIFLRVGYGRGPGASMPQIWVTVGKGSNGAGGITDVLVAETRTGSGNTTATTTVVPGFASSGDGSMCVMLPFAVGSMPAATPAFVIDRSRDANGDPTVDGVTLAVRSTATTPSTLSTGISPSGLPTLICAAYSTGSQDVGTIPVALPYTLNGVVLASGNGFGAGILAPVFPWTCYAPGVAPWQSLAAVSFAGADDPGGVFSVFIAGQERTFRSIPISGMQSGWGVCLNPAATALSSYVGVAILWE